VLKIGASLIYSQEAAGLDGSFLEGITGEISLLAQAGKEVIIVSSGAIALGMSLLKFQQRPKELKNLQAAAALGQPELMDVYRRSFGQKGLNCAQLLLTREDFSDRRRYLNAKNTIFALLELGSIPIINENDTVSTEEIKFGDNDCLSALVASLVSADLLIILSDVEGLLDKENKLIRLVDEITVEIKKLASPTDKSTSVGGMITKIEAAGIAVSSGIPCVVACGRKKNIISSIIGQPYALGTLFMPKKRLKERERWIAFGSKPEGRVVIDDGAKKALLNHKSLLSVGVVGVKGDFASGAIVAVLDGHQEEFARGKVRVSSRQLNKVKGKRSVKEVMHCDDIVIL
jgi:glutamate 5-kinase